MKYHGDSPCSRLQTVKHFQNNRIARPVKQGLIQLFHLPFTCSMSISYFMGARIQIRYHSTVCYVLEVLALNSYLPRLPT